MTETNLLFTLIIGLAFILVSALLLFKFYKMKRKGYDRNSPEHLKANILSRLGLLLLIFGIIFTLIFFDN